MERRSEGGDRLWGNDRLWGDDGLWRDDGLGDERGGGGRGDTGLLRIVAIGAWRVGQIENGCNNFLRCTMVVHVYRHPSLPCLREMFIKC